MWEIPVKDWEKVSLRSYELIMSEADKSLKDISEDSEKTTTRVYGVIGILILIYSALISGVIKCYADDKYILLVIPLVALAIFLSFSFYNLYKLIKPREVWRLGTMPADIFTTANFEFDESDTDEDKIKRVYINIIEQYQDKITRNIDVNNQRIKQFNRSVKLIFYPLVGFLVVIVAYSIILSI